MRIKLSKQNWRLVGQKMGWLKKKAQWIVGFSKKEFLDKTLAEKKVIAKEQPISSDSQPLFFTQKYEGKGTVLRALAGNVFCNEKTEKMFSTQEYEGKSGTLEVLRKRMEKKKLDKKAQIEGPMHNIHGGDPSSGWRWNRKLEFTDEKITYEGINFICDFVVTDVSEKKQDTQHGNYDMQISEGNYRIDRSNGHNPFGMEHDADVLKKLLEDDEDFFNNLEAEIEDERMDEFIELYKLRKREDREENE